MFSRFGQHDPSKPIAAHRRQKPRLFCRIGPHAPSVGYFIRHGVYWRGRHFAQRQPSARLDHSGNSMVCHGLGAVLRWGPARSGIGGASVGVLVLGGLKRLESRWKQDRHATLSLTVDAGGPTEDELTTRLQAIGYEIRPWTVIFVDQGRQHQLSAEVRWRARPQEAHSPAFFQSLVHQTGVLQLEWKP
jgi:hypothetical protein